MDGHVVGVAGLDLFTLATKVGFAGKARQRAFLQPSIDGDEAHGIVGVLVPPGLCDALRRPEQRQLLADIIAQLGMLLQSLHGMSCSAAMNGLVVGIPIAVAGPAAVALHFPADGRDVSSQRPGDVAEAVTFLQKLL